MISREPCRGCGATLEGVPPGTQCPRCALALALESVASPEASPLHELLAEPRSPGTVQLHFLRSFDFIEEIGRGGMGVVFRAHQRSLGRDVALKLILAGRVAPGESAKRFRKEAEAIAALDHPHIVRVHEAGTHDGLHFLSMEYVDGGTLANLISNSGTEREARVSSFPAWMALRSDPCLRVRLFRDVCDAVEHAHSRGVFHRDLKPSNILLDREGRVHVSDFGFARMDDGDLSQTWSGQIFGTVAYLSPEMATGGVSKAGAASEVWGLGVVLYEMLCGHWPFEADSRSEILRRILQEDPKAPGRWSGEIDPVSPEKGTSRGGRAAIPIYAQIAPRSGEGRDLEAVCLKCLEKEPTSRYPSVRALMDDVDRWLAGRPVEARRIGIRARAWRWGRRHPMTSFLATATLLTLIVSFVVAVRSRQGEKVARKGELEARARIRQHRLARVEDLALRGENSEAFATLAAVIRDAPHDEEACRRALFGLAFREFAIIPRYEFSLGGADGTRVQLSYDSRFLGAVDDRRTIRLWDLKTGQQRALPFQVDSEVVLFDFDSLHTRLVVGTAQGWLSLIDLESGAPVCPTLYGPGPLTRSHFSLDGRRLHLVWGDRVGTIELATGRVEASLPETQPGEELLVVGTTPLVAGRIGTNYVYREAGTTNVRSIVPVGDVSSNVPTMPGAAHAVSRGVSNRELWLWDIRTGKGSLGFRSSNAPVVVHAVSSAAAHTLTLVDGGVTLHILDWITGEARTKPIPLSGAVSYSTFRRNDGILMFLEAPRTIRFLDTARGADAIPSLRTPYSIRQVVADPELRRIATLGDDGLARVFDVGKPGQPSIPLDLTNCWIGAFDSSGRKAAVSGRRPGPDGKPSDERVWLLDPLSGQPRRGLPHADDASWLSFSKDGSLLVTGSNDGKARVWNAETGEPVTDPLPHPDEVWQVDFSPDGKFIVTSCYDGISRIWDARTGSRVGADLNHGGLIHFSSFSPDGSRIVVAGAGSPRAGAQLWDARSCQKIGAPMLHWGKVRRAKFSPDGTRVVTASWDGTARIWDGSTGLPAGPPLLHGAPVYQAEFDRNATRLLTASLDSTLQVWDPQRGTRESPLMRFDGPVSSGNWDPENKVIVAGNESGTVRFWNASSGRALGPPIPYGTGEVRTTVFNPAGTRVLVAIQGAGSRIAEVPRVDGPAPTWFAPFLEAIAGSRLIGEERIQPIPVGEVAARLEEVRQSLAQDEYTRWSRWVLGSPHEVAP